MTDDDVKKFASDHHEFDKAMPVRERIVLTIVILLIVLGGYGINHLLKHL